MRYTLPRGGRNNVRRTMELLSDHVVETLHVVCVVDVFLWKSGIRFTEPPPSPYGDWEEHSHWAIDSACQSVRMTLACNPLGAAAISRTQLERWSANRSTSSGREQPDGMPTAVTSGHPRTPGTASDLGMGRLTRWVKRPSKRVSTRPHLVYGTRMAWISLTRLLSPGCFLRHCQAGAEDRDRLARYVAPTKMVFCHGADRGRRAARQR